MKKNFFLSILSGLLLGISWPTYGITFFIFFSIVPLLIVLNNISKKKSKFNWLKVLSLSFLTFIIWNLITTWWIINSSFFGFIFAVTVNSFLYSVLILIYFETKKFLPKFGSYILFVSLWISFEKFHTLWDFSWPWLNLGNVFSEKISWIQWYEYTGSFGGTLWVLTINIFIYLLINSKIKSKKTILFKTFRILLLVVSPITISFFISKNEKKKDKSRNFILFQPNIDPYTEKYNLSNLDNLELIEKMTDGNLGDSTNYLITPETFFSEENGEDVDLISSSILTDSVNKFINKNKSLNILSGIQLYKFTYNKDSINDNSIKVNNNVWINFYNSAILYNSNKDYQIYHKSKFVPGVEMLPYKSFFKPLIGDFMLNLGGTVYGRTPQENRSLFTSNLGDKFASIICYESIYGSFVRKFSLNGAEFFTIISNDAWWGETEGHRQLLSYSKLRAIENRKSIARVANTGISGFIDSSGNIFSKLEYNTRGILKNNLPLNNYITFYVKYGDYISRISNLMLLILISIVLSKIVKKYI